MRYARSVSLIVIFFTTLMGLDPLITPATAKLAPADGIGGSGGAPFRLDCGESGLLIGITGRLRKINCLKQTDAKYRVLTEAGTRPRECRNCRYFLGGN
jgi:hypothetical protein